jgi:hypothetical protein
MINISALQSKWDALPSCSYANARGMFPLFANMLQEESDAAGMNDWLNFGNASYKGTIQRFVAQMTAFGSDLNDTSSHVPDADWSRWGAFKSLGMQIAIEANAIEDGMGHIFQDNLDFITTDLPNSVADAPGVIGHAVGGATQTVAAGVGDFLAKFLEGAGVPLLVGAAILVFVYVKARG